VKSWLANSRAARARALFGVSLVCTLLCAGHALAQRVLLVQPPPSDLTLSEAFNRLRAELLLQDFEVSVLELPPEGMTADALEAEAKKAGAFAGVSLTRDSSGATADVCIADRVTGKRTQRRLAVAGVAQAPRVLAVRAVDLLRSSLRELEPGERPPRDVVGVAPGPPPPELRAWSAPPPLWQLRAAGGALGAGRFGSAFGGAISVMVRPTPRLELGALVVGPLLGARYSASTGSALVRQELALARGSWNLLPEGVLRLGPSLGAGVYHLRAEGEVTRPLRGKSGDLFSFAATGGAAAELKLTSALSLGLTVDALLLTPEPVVAVDTQQGSARNPLILASLGLGVAF
jgi:hypothetical protein